MAELLERHHDTLAAVILEPVVQGAGGMWFYHPEYLRRLREACDRYGVLLIADEIATGFGRTGPHVRLRVGRHHARHPVRRQGATGGYLSFAAVAATDRVAQTFRRAIRPSSCTGPPSWATRSPARWPARRCGCWKRTPRCRASPKSRRCSAGCSLLRCQWPQVADVRVLGAIGVVEMRRPVDMATLQRRFVEEGIWVRPFGRLVYLMPPFVIRDNELEALARGLLKVISEVE